MTASDAADVPLRLRSDVDEATPSASAQIIAAIQQLSTSLSDLSMADRAILLAENALGRAAGQSYGQAGILQAAELVRLPAKLVLVDVRNGDFVAQANRFPDPRRVDVIIQPGSAGEKAVLTDGTTIGTDRRGAWLCLGLACLSPVFEPEALGTVLRQAR